MNNFLKIINQLSQKGRGVCVRKRRGRHANMKMIMFEVLMVFLVFNVDIVAGIIRCWGTQCENPLLFGLIPLNPIKLVAMLLEEETNDFYDFIFWLPLILLLYFLVRIHYYRAFESRKV